MIIETIRELIQAIMNAVIDELNKMNKEIASLKEQVEELSNK